MIVIFIKFIEVYIIFAYNLYKFITTSKLYKKIVARILEMFTNRKLYKWAAFSHFKCQENLSICKAVNHQLAIFANRGV